MIPGLEEKLADKRIRFILFAGSILFFLFTRLFRLDLVPFGPHGMHVDELGSAYDAVCIKNWGVDQTLVKYPPYFKGLAGTGQNALYTYLAVIVFKILGVSLFNFRLVAVICAFAAFLCMYALSYRVFKEWTYVFASLALMTIMPVFMMSEHWGLESYLFLTMSIISMAFFMTAIQGGNTACYILSGIFWGITLYTYAISWIVVPVFLILSLLYLIFTKAVNIKQTAALAIPMIIVGTPIFVQFLVITEIIEPFSLPFMDFFTMSEFRSHSISFAYIMENLKHSTYVLFVADDQIYNSNSRFGLIYYVSIPFILAGFIQAIVYSFRSIKRKELNPWVLIVLFYIVSRLVSLITHAPNTNRMAHIYLPFLLFTVLGIRWVIERIKFKKTAAFLIAAAFGISFLFFARYFYSWSGYGQDTRASMMCAPSEMGETLAEIERQYGSDHKITAIANDGYANPLMCALFTETSPYDFREDRINGCFYGVPNELDLSGETVYFIDNDLHHITDYLVTEGFAADRDRCEGFAIVTKVKVE